MIRTPDFNVKVQFFIGLTTQSGANLSHDDAVAVVDRVLVSHGIDGFNVALNNGYWKGRPEASITVTVFDKYAGLFSQIEWPHHAAALLAEYLDQECVLVDVVHANAHLVGGNCNGRS